MNPFAAFAEGVSAVPQSCDTAIVLTSLLAVVLAQHRWWMAGGVAVGAVLGGWNVVLGGLSINGDSLGGAGLWIGYLVVFAGLMAIVILRRQPLLAAGIGGVTVFVATLWWIPCVGRQLGAVLSESAFSRQVAPMAAYMIGLMFPVFVIAGVFAALSAIPRARPSAA